MDEVISDNDNLIKKFLRKIQNMISIKLFQEII